MNGKIVTLRLYLESSDFIYNYTGKISKAILLTEVPELEYTFRAVKGFFKQIRVSPPLSDGAAIVPIYAVRHENVEMNFELKPVLLKGEYVIEVGAPEDVANAIHSRFKQVEGVKTRLKFENAVITYIIEETSFLEPRIDADNGVFEVKTVSPALLPNPLTPTQHVRRFTANPGTLLWIPYLMSKGVMSYSRQVAERALIELESCLSEHYSTRWRTIFVNYDGNREPALHAKARYIIVGKGDCRELARKTLETAIVYGIGASRANGFGSVAVTTPKQGHRSTQTQDKVREPRLFLHDSLETSP